MRLWHKKLIPVLPRKQLLAQWRECCAIISNIANKGTPNHILVNKVTEYSWRHFQAYVDEILNEMSKRSYNVTGSTMDRYKKNLEKAKPYFYDGIMINKEIYPDWMNDRYFRQCYCNLEEKYDCGIIPEKEWQKVYDLYMQKVHERINKRRLKK